MAAIHPLSVVALHLECLRGGDIIGSATGFVVSRDDTDYLITNWHVVTGRDPGTCLPLSTGDAVDPETIAVWHHARGRLGSWIRKSYSLVDSSVGRRWLEHARGREIDVVALPIAREEDVEVYSMDLKLAGTDLVISPSEPVSIIGFPLGLAAYGKYPIWKTGHIASDIELNYEGKPIFLIDATTKGGMSGSPVVVLKTGLRRTSSGWKIDGGEFIRFLGVYSGRINSAVDVGMVWKPAVLDEILPA